MHVVFPRVRWSRNSVFLVDDVEVRRAMSGTEPVADDALVHSSLATINVEQRQRRLCGIDINTN